MRVPVLGLLCACQTWYGLDDTNIAPRDAPVTCPPIGTEPAFSKTVQQIVFRFCTEYSVSPSHTLAVAKCNNAIVHGMPDAEELVPGMGLPMHETIGTMPIHTFAYFAPIAVDDGRVFVQEHEVDGPVNTIRTVDYRRTAGTWQRHTFLPIAAVPERFGTVARVGDTLRVIASSNDGVFREYVEDAGGWRLAGSVPKSELGIVGVVHRVSLSGDALRLWITSQVQPVVSHYTDRASVDSPWRRAVEVEAPPVDTMMTSDCSRLYFNGRQSVFYVERR